VGYSYLDRDAFIERHDNPKCFIIKDAGKTIGGFILMEKDTGF